MEINILGLTRDLRTDTPVIYTQMSINDYLDLIGENFDEFNIQRRRVEHKAYTRLKQDIIAGTVIPTITLSVKPTYVNDILNCFENTQNEDDLKSQLKNLLIKPNSVDILDGLQRTHILNDIVSEGIELKQDQKLLLEFWVEKDINNLIYRLIVLNSGQKSMSMKHQIELLFYHIKDQLQEDLTNIEIFTERDGRRRNTSCKYPFNLLAQAYQCFLIKSPELDKDNLVAKEMLNENVLDSNPEDLGKTFTMFKKYLALYAELDKQLYRIYENKSDFKNWLVDENVIQSFFASLSKFGKTDARQERIDIALKLLINQLSDINALGELDTEDIIGLDQYNEVKKGINPRKSNVGFETRRFLCVCFEEYFRDEGETKISKLWAEEAK